jgi:hypothetical protein
MHGICLYSVNWKDYCVSDELTITYHENCSGVLSVMSNTLPDKVKQINEEPQARYSASWQKFETQDLSYANLLRLKL